MLDKVQLICLSLLSAPRSWTRHQRCRDGVGRRSVQGEEERERWWMPAVSTGIPAQQLASCAAPGMLISHLFAELECGIWNYKYTLHFYGNSVRWSLSGYTSVRPHLHDCVAHGRHVYMPTGIFLWISTHIQIKKKMQQLTRLEENIIALLFFLDKLEKKWSHLKVEY